MKFIDSYRMVRRAEYIARKFHKGQTYGDGSDFCNYHLSLVFGTAMTAFDDPSAELLSTAWLHDILEDTSYNQDQLYLDFTKDVADAVVALTIPKSGGNRKNRFQSKIPELKNSQIATYIRLVDRLCNMCMCLGAPDSGKSKMYRGEYPWFREVMAFSRENPDLKEVWSRLDNVFHQLNEAASEMDL